MNNQYISKTDADTQKLGQEFAKTLLDGDVVLLYGDLGFGKTTFVKGIAKGLNVKNTIISPTFTIVREYENLYHLDLYRIDDEKQLQEIGLPDLLEGSEIKIIEWPENMQGYMPQKRIDVKFLLNKDNTRTINIIKYE